MSKYIINGGGEIRGKIRVQGAKNSVLALFAAAVLSPSKIKIHNCPSLIDVSNMMKILEALGGYAEWKSGTAEIDCGDLTSYEISTELAKELRSSVFLLGAVLGRLKKAKVAYPGGCDIGLRPIDLHLKALRELKVDITEEGGYIYCDASSMECGNITLTYPSVGATENIILLTVLSDGVTTVSNAAREPEIIDLQNFLNAMGADVRGAGTSFITVKGVKKLHGAEFYAMPDRIAAGTYMLAAAACGGELTLTEANPEHLRTLITRLKDSGCSVYENENNITLVSKERLRPFGMVITEPYPGFPTDLQAPLMACAAVADGVTVIYESIFETRFKQVPELIKMGANILTRDRTALIDGVPKLSGAEITAKDLRGGAALVIAALKAEQTSVINDVFHIERGYENFVETLQSVGVDIARSEVNLAF